MWNYPFDPEEIEGDNYESPLWMATIVFLGAVAVIYFGLHLIAFILK